jgi:hypothetical protein
MIAILTDRKLLSLRALISYSRSIASGGCALQFGDQPVAPLPYLVNSSICVAHMEHMDHSLAVLQPCCLPVSQSKKSITTLCLVSFIIALCFNCSSKDVVLGRGTCSIFSCAKEWSLCTGRAFFVECGSSKICTFT